MPEEDQPILDPTPGVLNELNDSIINNRTGTGASNINSGLSATQERNKKDREPKLITNKGEYFALALFVDIIVSPYPPNTVPSSIINETDELKKYLKIYARVPEFDSALPMPDIYKNFRPSGTGTKTRSMMRDMALIKQHPFFIQELPNQNNENAEENQIPTPGSLVKVKYDDKQHKTGTYLGVYKDGYKLGNISKTTGSDIIQTPQALRNNFSLSAQNAINVDRGPLVVVGETGNEEIEKMVIEIANNALPGPTINGHETVIMFNLSSINKNATNYKSFNLSHYGNRLKNLFILLERRLLKPAIRVLKMAAHENKNLKVNSSFRPGMEDLTVGDILEVVKKAKDSSPDLIYYNWNKLSQKEGIGEIDPHALINFLEGFGNNTKVLSSQKSLRDHFECPNDTTTDCRVKVARVGTSKHESGFAIDIGTNPAEIYTWLVNNMYKYGFYRTVRSERWHWRFNETNKKVRVFSIIDRFHETWDGNSLPTSDLVSSMPLRADDSDG